MGHINAIKKVNCCGREIKMPGIFQHFKKEMNGELMLYCLTAVSEPVATDALISYNEILEFYHTELEKTIKFARHGDKYVHLYSIEPKQLCIYTALYGDRMTYARPYDMFFSEIDKEKYPDADFKYRLEPVD